MKRNKIFLHSPNLFGNELKYLKECINKNYLTFGRHSDLFLKHLKKITASKFPALVQNCTSGLHLCLKILDTKEHDEVIAPSITFIASINAIKYCGANPVFMDVDKFCNIDIQKTTEFILKQTYNKNGFTFNKKTKKRISSVLVVHTFGNLANINKDFIKLCKKKSINIIEDAAECLGSYYLDKKKFITLAQ